MVVCLYFVVIWRILASNANTSNNYLKRQRLISENNFLGQNSFLGN